MRPGLRALAFVLVLGGALTLPHGTLGHALLISSDPPAGTSVPAAPTFVTLTFGEAADPRLSTVRVLDAAGGDHASGPAESVAGTPSQLRAPVEPLPDGVYTVAWRTVSAVDGHASAGSFAFAVGAGTVVTAPPTSEGAGAPTGSGLAVVARWLLYAGLAGLLGAGLVGSILHPRPPRRLVPLAMGSWTLAAAGTLGVAAVQWLDSGAGPGTFLASSVGVVVAARVAVVLAAGVAVVRARRDPTLSATRRLFAVTLVVAAGGLLVDVLGGHAAASAQAPLAVAVQWVHALAAGLWMGGLVALLIAVRGLPTDEKTIAVRRYSTWAGVFIGLVAVTGIARAIDQVGSLIALVGTDFGRIVVAKSGGLLVLAALGAFNRFINVPAAAKTLGGLRRAGSAEATVGALVLLLTAALVNAVPPSSAGPVGSAVEPLVVTGSDFGTSIRLRVTVSPGTAGFNTFSASVVDYDSAAPVPASSVSLRFALASRPGVGASRLDLASGPPGTFGGQGGNLAIDGIWRVTAVVAAPSGAVEVPLVLATRVALQPVSADSSITPVIYTVSLPGGDTVQVYLDPGRAGANDLHVTFFDAGGGELAVPRVTIAVSRPGAPGELLDARPFAAGHFVAALEAEASGTLGVDAVGPDPDGIQLHAYLVIEVAP